VVTPRSGSPVEIQALWFNAVKIMDDFATAVGDSEGRTRFAGIASRLQATFNRLFWNEDAGCLYDVVVENEHDAAIRPNQIFAVSLPHTMLAAQRAVAVVKKVEELLLTPFGLRTLAPQDPSYQPRYEGNQYRRDAAYHQGTVWPWLLGAFITAYIKVHGSSPKSRDRGRELLQPLQSQLSAAGLGQLAEIYDAEPPQRPRGCFAQAWSVGELLRVLHADIYQIPNKPAQTATAAPAR
jgi:glycogen debranching enzyme